MDDLTRYLEQHRDRFVDDLKAALRIPSISAQPEHRDDMRRCADHIAAHLRELEHGAQVGAGRVLRGREHGGRNLIASPPVRAAARGYIAGTSIPPALP